jgi:hypothetical protein
MLDFVLPALGFDHLFGPIVFRAAVRHAVVMGDIKNGEARPAYRSWQESAEPLRS